jgi:glutamate-5-semialdehyde dehydrogenase
MPMRIWLKAEAIAVNAKTHRYGTCNTMETLLVDKVIAAHDFTCAGSPIRWRNRCELLRGCAAYSVKSCEGISTPRRKTTGSTEYLAPILAIRVVDGLDQAIEHINTYSSQHTDSIVTENYTKGRRFITEVDSSSVMINASTRFADGFEYGLGAEIGISTDKFHARGPVGLEGLTSQKYVVFGDGQVRS